MKRIFASFLLSATLAGGALAQQSVPAGQTATAIFAGGCFWCTEADFDKVPGVVSTTSGYTGGNVANPNYYQVSAGRTGHTEAVEIGYDPIKVTYKELLDKFWRSIDPLAKNRQFCDVGSQYRTAIFYRTEEERKLAEASKKDVEAKLKKKVETEIVAAGSFYKAEDYHQNFYQRNQTKYKFYRWNCGRDQRLEELWGKAEAKGS
ncbi:MAG: peptide-methionine (S)-S-oxide reductase MsrA [Rhizobiales bacterium]|nr:peptide-methionine (S)-S-oxide reductase MsrA [Hyphomicrobiales bacterium]